LSTQHSPTDTASKHVATVTNHIITHPLTAISHWRPRAHARFLSRVGHIRGSGRRKFSSGVASWNPGRDSVWGEAPMQKLKTYV